MPSDFINSGSQVVDAITPIGSSIRDVEVIVKMNAEKFHIMFPPISYRKLSRTETVVDELYKESVGTAVHNTAIKVPALFIFGAQTKALHGYGIEEEHNAACLFSNRVNATIGIDPSTGDLLAYLGIYYEILTVKHVDYITNTQVPLNLIATIKQSQLR